MNALGALVGLLAGLGLFLVVRGVPLRRGPSFEQRLAPYLRDAMPPSRLLVEGARPSPFPVLQRLAEPFLTDLARRVERILGGTASVRRRLHRAGSESTVEQFRIEQVLWGGLGLLGGATLSLGLLALGMVERVLPLLLLTVIAAAS
ncbi:MAG: pilus assembly protein TadB, partial [Chloroflexi bacterium]|nr:pilus assembly protein TadB [Chloroflexota bacterium]